MTIVPAVNVSRSPPGWFAAAGADLKINPRPDDSHFPMTAISCGSGRLFYAAAGDCCAGTSKRRARSDTLPPVPFTLADHIRGAGNEMSEAGVGLAFSLGV
jgi:hypothetical protein